MNGNFTTIKEKQMNTFKHLALTAAVSLFILSIDVPAQMHHHNSTDSKVQQEMAADDTSKACLCSDEMTQKMGKATFEQSVNGLHVQVWLITQEEHKRMMSAMMNDSAKMHKMQEGMSKGEMKHDMGGMMHGDMKMDHKMGDMKDTMHQEMDHKQMMESMMFGTHHIMMVLTQDKSGEPVKDAVVEVAILSPSKKVAKSNLAVMMDHFGGNLELSETGQYGVSINIKAGDHIANLRFEYTVK